MAELLKDALEMTSDLTIANLFLGITNTKIYCYDVEGFKSYYYDEKSCLYVAIGLQGASSIVSRVLNEFINKHHQENRDQMLLKPFHRLKLAIQSGTRITKITQVVLQNCIDKTFVHKLDSVRHEINFKNGVIDLRTLEFRPREQDDFVSKCLDYDYEEEQDEEKMNEILEIIGHTCNDDMETMEFNLHWLGYCLTGEVKEQRFLVTVGHNAQNGKTTLMDMFKSAFSIYCVELAKDTFEEGYQNAHKQFIRCKVPVRIAISDELSSRQLNADKLKKFVDGSVASNIILYGSAEDILLHCKLSFSTNNTPRITVDAGVTRRGIAQEFTNQFLDYETYLKRKDEKGVYLARDLETTMKTKKFKMAFAHIMLAYANVYYERLLNSEKVRLHIPQTNREQFQRACADNDGMASFIEQYFVRTNLEEDRINKFKFQNFYNEHTKTNTSWATILNGIKRIGLKYDDQKREGNQKGVILGLRFKENKPQQKDLFIEKPTVQRVKKSPLDQDLVTDDEQLDISENDTDTEDEFDLDTDVENDIEKKVRASMKK